MDDFLVWIIRLPGDWSISSRFLSFPLYLVLQAIAIKKSTGIWKWIAGIPLVPMIFITLATIIAAFNGANTWPLLLLFLSPLAFLYMCTYIILRGVYLAYKRVNSDNHDQDIIP